jgi:hypothetical protein
MSKPYLYLNCVHTADTIDIRLNFTLQINEGF